VGIISNGAFITFKILNRISVKANEEMASERKLLETTDELDSHFKP
jgi:hypothetical protein